MKSGHADRMAKLTPQMIEEYTGAIRKALTALEEAGARAGSVGPAERREALDNAKAAAGNLAAAADELAAVIRAAT